MAQGGSLRGRRVLVVEDDAMIALMIEDMLDALGCSIVGPAMGLGEATRLAAGTETIDAALLDVNVGGEPVFPLADALRARGVPIVFCTGYGAGGLRATDQGTPVLTKPYRLNDVVAVLSAAVRPDAVAPKPRPSFTG